MTDPIESRHAYVKAGDVGQFVDFKVMVRPLKGLQALVEEMGARLAE